jgi:hypothetical protein
VHRPFRSLKGSLYKWLLLVKKQSELYCNQECQESGIGAFLWLNAEQ